MKRQGFLAGLLLLVLLVVAAVPPGGWAQAGFPDLTIVDIWFEGSDICYQMQNVGPEPATDPIDVDLWVDPIGSNPPADMSQVIQDDLAPGQRRNGCFAYGFTCTVWKHDIDVRAQYVPDADSTNDKRREIWFCDDMPPQITSGPTVSSITAQSARVSWTTDETSWGTVRFGTKPDVYTGEVEGTSWAASHQVDLSGLQPGTTYQFVVDSRDQTNLNTSTSSPGFFTTSSPLDAEAPEITSVTTAGKFLPMQFDAWATDNMEVHRVEFRMDGNLMGMDFSAPFQAFLDPNYMGYDPDTFWYNHALAVTAFDDNDNSALMNVNWDASFLAECGNSQHSVEILEPYEGYPIFTTSGVAPSEIMTIEVEAKEFDGFTMGPCMPMGPCVYWERWSAITDITFAMDGATIVPDYVGPHPDDEYVQVYTYDPAGLPLGSHRLRARAVTSEGCPFGDSVGIEVAGPPDMEVDRTVTRLGNYFQINVQVTNVGDGPARVVSLSDTLIGFQAARDTSSSRSVSFSYQPVERQSTVSFTTGYPHNLLLDPGDSDTYRYLAVPVLYPGIDAVEIGGSGLLEYADVAGNIYTQDISLTSEWVEGSGGDPRARLTDAVTAARVASDYLLVTNPFNLGLLYNRADVNELLAKMAELAIERNGVLGYYNAYYVTESAFSAGDLLAISHTIYGSNAYAEVVLGDLTEDSIRVYLSFGEWTGGLYELPIAHDLHSGDVLAVGDILPTTRAPFLSNLDEILVAEPGAGEVLQYSVDCDLVGGAVSTCDVTEWQLMISYDAGDALVLGNVDPASDRPAAQEILLANDGGTVEVYSSDFLLETFSTSYQSGDKLAVGEVVGDGEGEETVLADVSGNHIFIYTDRPNHFGEVYRIDSVPLDTEDDLAVGDVTGDDVEEILIADKSADRIKVYGFRSGVGFVELSNWSFALASDDRMLVGNFSKLGKEEIVIARATSAGTPTAGDLEFLHYTTDGPPGDRAALDALLNPGGDWGDAMATLGASPDLWTDRGHLLLVGETGIIPAFTAYWDLPYTDRGRVEYMDRDYANSTGNADRPELSMGRIIGNDPESLIKPIQASIDVVLGDRSFNHSDAYAVSGYSEGAGGGSDPIDFVDARNKVADKMDDHFTSVLEQNTPDEWTLFHSFEGKDAIALLGHGGSTSWDIIGTADVDRNFRPGTNRPLVYGVSCNTGRYQGNYSLAESFLNNGASSYIGATAVANDVFYRLVAQDFFGRVDSSHTLGSALRDAKRHRILQNNHLYDDVYNAYQCAIFHFYGDPKLTPFGTSTQIAAEQEPAELPLGADAPAGTATLHITVPDYEINQRQGMDLVEIPGGDLVLIPGQPRVPSFPVLQGVGAGIQVQSVTLAGKSEPELVGGLQIPDYTLAWVQEGAAPDVTPYEEETWWPDHDFDWDVLEGPGDTTELALMLYPFQYYTPTGNVRYYQEYTFTIEYTTPGIKIAATHLARQAFEPGQAVVADIALESSLQTPEDVVVEALVWSDTAGEEADGLPLRTLRGVQGWATFAVEWDSSGFAPGDYHLDLAVRSSDGELLDRALIYFSLGISAGAITKLTATPALFTPGDEIALSLKFENIGTVPISGTASIHVQDEAGATVAAYEAAIADLAAGQSTSLNRTWDTEAAQPGAYAVTGYVTYGGQMAGPASVWVRTRPRFFLPLVLKDRAAP